VKTDSSAPLSGARDETQGGVSKRMLQVVGQFVLLVAILAITSGKPRWIWMWVFVGAGLVILAINAILLPRDLISERGQPKGNVKAWDRRLTSLAVIAGLAQPVVAGLDERLGWSRQLSVPVRILGVVAFLLSQLLFTWAMTSNRFFSTAVRIQDDRGQSVAQGGPYRYVRHPGYVGHILSGVATAVLLGSLWALVPAVVSGALLVVRTGLEDRMLCAELAGYEAYAHRVRYRLLPGIW
jgi:protein-S-isoprenylcysteine O-methyltransferase Ste14